MGYGCVMTGALLESVSRYADAHADGAGVAATPVAGLSLIRATEPSGLDYAISRPLVALVVQGRKDVAMGPRRVSLRSGDSLLIAADVPTVSQITRASAEMPYYAFVLDLDVSLIVELTAEMPDEGTAETQPMQAKATDAEVADVALRMMRLLDRPTALPVLAPQIVRELHYWLLVGRHGTAIYRLGWPEGQVNRVARAVALLRREFDRPLRVEQLAALAGMSLSSFYQHFRAVTSLSPLQFQKQLRLIEARRRMLADGITAGSAAYSVGYESVSQFTREYGRMFGLPPGRDIEALRRRTVRAGNCSPPCEGQVRSRVVSRVL